MRDRIGILLMEDQNGEVAVQLFADPITSKAAYENLAGSPVDPVRRATFISLEYGGASRIEAITKMLPVVNDPQRHPDGYVLGTGPINFPKKDP